jgi:hypothetical protein
MTTISTLEFSASWVMDCRDYRGRVLTGRFGHYCPEHHEQPVDETCPEWPCPCAAELQREAATPAPDELLADR